MTDPTTLSLKHLVEAYANGSADPVTATAAYLDRIADRNPDLNAFISVDGDAALIAANASASRWCAGKALSLLDGAPIALKDNIDIAGAPTTNGSAFGPTPTENATVVERLQAAGAVILGKLNQHELALGATSDNVHWGQAHNPHRNGWTPGGSSGGSGAAVAANLAAATLGTDTMGSVRIPAAYCGVYGIKPTYGLVSTQGVSPLAWTLDHVGPLARTADDCALMLASMMGWDQRSIDSVNVPLDRRPIEVNGLKVGFLQTYMTPDVQAAYGAFMDRLRNDGANLVELNWPEFDFSRARLAGLLVSEAESAHAYKEELAHRPERFSDGIRSMLEFGAHAPAPKLVAAERRIRAVRHQVLASFMDVDVIILPTAPMPAFPFAGDHPGSQADFAAPANFAGTPAISMPGGETADGLPIGMQIMGPTGSDFRLCALAQALSGKSQNRAGLSTRMRVCVS